MSEWNQTNIGDLCDTISETYRRNDNEVVLVNTSDVLEGKVLNHATVANKNLKGQFKKTFKKNDILYSEIRPANKRFAFIDFDSTENYIASTKLMVLRPNTKNVLPRFLFAILKSYEIIDELQHLAETRSGTFPQITFNGELAPMKVYLPDVKTQEKIVSIIDTIENKIELNNNINKNLLDQSLTIFKNNFGGLDKNGRIGDYCQVKSGFAFKSAWWEDTGVPVIKIGSINQDEINLNDCSYVSDDKIETAGDFSVIKGDLLIAMTGATIGKFAMIPALEETVLVNQRVGKFFLGDNPIEKIPFIYCTLKQPEIITEVINRGQGSAQPNISSSDIMNIECVMPEKSDLNSFNTLTTHMFETIAQNQLENKKLSQLQIGRASCRERV